MIALHINGGEGGIRTHGPDFNRDNRLAGDPDRPLQHLSAWAGIRCYSSMFSPICKTQGQDSKHLYIRDEGNIRPIEKLGAGSSPSEASGGGWEGPGEDGGGQAL